MHHSVLLNQCSLLERRYQDLIIIGLSEMVNNHLSDAPKETRPNVKLGRKQGEMCPFHGEVPSACHSGSTDPGLLAYSKPASLDPYVVLDPIWRASQI